MPRIRLAVITAQQQVHDIIVHLREDGREHDLEAEGEEPAYGFKGHFRRWAPGAEEP